MLTVETIRKIRLAIHRDGKTIRETVRDLGDRKRLVEDEAPFLLNPMVQERLLIKFLIRGGSKLDADGGAMFSAD